MAIESWMDFPILVIVVIITRSKVNAIVEARQKHRQIQKERKQKEVDKLLQGQYDLEEEFKEVTTQKEVLAKQLTDNAEKQTNLLKVVEQLTEKENKLEMQPLHTQGFMTSFNPNVSNLFGNLSTSFQVKADIDIGKLSGTEPTPSDELNFDQWCICRASARPPAFLSTMPHIPSSLEEMGSHKALNQLSFAKRGE